MDLREFAGDFSNYFSKARRAFQNGDYEKALENYELLTKKYPQSPILNLEKGGTLVRLQRLEEARKEFEACLSLDPRNSVALLNTGNIMALEGKAKEAEKFYLLSLYNEEDQAEAHLNLGLLYSGMPEKKKEATLHLHRFMELAPNDPERMKIGNMVKKLDVETNP